jgi:outer membrane murein-binding lipoprotein Lpp
MAEPKEQKPQKQEVINLQIIEKQLPEINSRVRLLEERTDQTRQKLKITDENLIRKTEKLKSMMDELHTNIDQLDKDIKDVKETIRYFAKELEGVASVGDLKVLEKYINMIDPTRFLTEKDVMRIVRREIGKA